MLPPRRLLPLRAFLRSLPLWNSAPALGQLILGAPGVGKTILLSLILLAHMLRGLPGCVLDPLGTLSEAFLFRLLCFLSEYPPGDDAFLWQRLRYIELGGDSVTPFPIYYQRHGESLWEAGNRLITVLERASPQLATSPLTWPAARRLGHNAGMLLTALSLQLDHVEDLLFNSVDWEKSGRFAAAISRNPQATDAVSYFKEYYLLLPRSEQRRIAGTFLDQVFMLTTDPKMRAVFSGSSTPGIDWEEVEAHPQLTIINGKGITDPTSLRFAMQWVLESLTPHLKERGRRQTPFVLLIDEFAHLAGPGTTHTNPLADLFDDLLARYARNNQEFVTLALQSVDQVDERLARTLLRLGTLITGRAGSVREARTIADQLVRKDIYRVQHDKKVWGKVDPPPYFLRYTSSYRDSVAAAIQQNPSYPYYILDYEPQHMSLENQTEDAAGRIQQLQALEFLCRPAVSEGTVSQEVVPLALRNALRDPDTGEDSFPDPEQDYPLIATVQQELAKRSGIPIQEILKAQESRLGESSRLTSSRKPEVQPSSRPLPAAARAAPPAQPPQSGHPQPRTERAPQRPPKKTTPPPPTSSDVTPKRVSVQLDEQGMALLRFIIEQPETPISALYKALSLSWRAGNQLRDSLTRQGLLCELELRTDTRTAGRPGKFLIPTLPAFELVGKDPPAGRGGVIHRHIQHRVCDGARAKGYSARLEYPLATGGIVDVHVENGQERIAVEIAVVSTPEREISHLRECLAANYDKVFTFFAEERLLQKIQEALPQVFSAEEVGKVKLLPVSKLSHLGS
jgi:hypothetical protein